LELRELIGILYRHDVHPSADELAYLDQYSPQVEGMVEKKLGKFAVKGFHSPYISFPAEEIPNP
tara:strand:- start:156 stop:347 length:192 start_codon:yes stop_codon:yes gene_type:complete